MKTITITQARQDLFNIVDKVITNSEPVQILSKRGGAVLVSADDWNAIQETIYLTSVKGFEESLKESENEDWIPEDQVYW